MSIYLHRHIMDRILNDDTHSLVNCFKAIRYLASQTEWPTFSISFPHESHSLASNFWPFLSKTNRLAASNHKGFHFYHTREFHSLYKILWISFLLWSFDIFHRLIKSKWHQKISIKSNQYLSVLFNVHSM